MNETHIRYMIQHNLFFPSSITEDVYLLGLSTNGNELLADPVDLLCHFVVKDDEKQIRLSSGGIYKFDGAVDYRLTIDGKKISYKFYVPQDAKCKEDLKGDFFSDFKIAQPLWQDEVTD